VLAITTAAVEGLKQRLNGQHSEAADETPAPPAFPPNESGPAATESGEPA
jgi:hypothetical protein